MPPLVLVAAAQPPRRAVRLEPVRGRLVADVDCTALDVQRTLRRQDPAGRFARSAVAPHRLVEQPLPGLPRPEARGLDQRNPLARCDFGRRAERRGQIGSQGATGILPGERAVRTARSCSDSRCAADVRAPADADDVGYAGGTASTGVAVRTQRGTECSGKGCEDDHEQRAPGSANPSAPEPRANHDNPGQWDRPRCHIPSIYILGI